MIVEWAAKADEGPFSSVSALDRLVYPNYEPMVTLGAAAAVTQQSQAHDVNPARASAKRSYACEAGRQRGRDLGRQAQFGTRHRRTPPTTSSPGESDITTRGRRFDEQLGTIEADLGQGSRTTTKPGE